MLKMLPGLRISIFQEKRPPGSDCDIAVRGRLIDALLTVLVECSEVLFQ